MIKSRLSLIACTILFFVPTSYGDTLEPVTGDPTYYGFFPESPLHLGAGFVPNNLALAKADCIEFTPMLLDGEGALSTTSTQTVVFTAQQLKQALSLDAKVDASYLAFKGGASLSFLSDESAINSAVTVVISATSEYSRKGASAAHLRKQYEYLRDDARNFEDVCGSRFVADQRQASNATAVITIYGLSTQEHELLKAGVSASGGWGAVSGSVEASLSQDIKRAAERQELSINTFANGGEGIGGLSDLVAAQTSNADSIANINKALGVYLKGFTIKNAAPLGFHVISMHFAGYNPTRDDLWSDNKERVTRDIVYAYRDVQRSIDGADGILNGSDPRRTMVDVSKDPVIASFSAEMKRRRGKIAQAYAACEADRSIAGAACVIPSFASLPDPIPPNPVPPVASYEIHWVNGSKLEGLDPIRTRAFLSNVFLINTSTSFPGTGLPNNGFRNNSTDITAQLEFINIRRPIVEVQVLDANMVFESLALKIDGTPDYADLFTLGASCCFISFPVQGWAGNLTQWIQTYIDKQFATVAISGTVDSAGTFAIHSTNSLGRSFYLPVAHAKWKQVTKIATPPVYGSTFENSITAVPLY